MMIWIQRQFSYVFPPTGEDTAVSMYTVHMYLGLELTHRCGSTFPQVFYIANGSSGTQVDLFSRDNNFLLFFLPITSCWSSDGVLHLFDSFFHESLSHLSSVVRRSSSLLSLCLSLSLSVPHQQTLKGKGPVGRQEWCIFDRRHFK